MVNLHHLLKYYTLPLKMVFLITDISYYLLAEIS